MWALLHLMTPAKDVMKRFFDSEGEINHKAMSDLIVNGVPVSENGLVVVKGKINTIKDVKIRAGDIAIGLEDIVNTGGLQEASRAVVTSNGDIELVAENDISVSGKLLAEGKEYFEGGEISLRAKNNIELNENAHLFCKR